jgi:hypothetical protein
VHDDATAIRQQISDKLAETPAPLRARLLATSVEHLKRAGVGRETAIDILHDLFKPHVSGKELDVERARRAADPGLLGIANL